MSETIEPAANEPATEATAAPLPLEGAATDLHFLSLFERFVKSQETIAGEMKRRNDIQDKFFNLAQVNSKVGNAFLDKAGKAAAAIDPRACKTCNGIELCEFWCHTGKYPKKPGS
jgi:hypothetical protein